MRSIVTGRSRGLDFCDLDLKGIEFGIPSANDTQILGFEGCELGLQSCMAEFLLDHIRFDGGQFRPLCCELVFFRTLYPGR